MDANDNTNCESSNRESDSDDNDDDHKKDDLLLLERVQEEQEQIEETLEGLLIFPNQRGPQEAKNKMEALFQHEEDTLTTATTKVKRKNLDKDADFVRTKKQIMKIIRKGINNPTRSNHQTDGC